MINYTGAKAVPINILENNDFSMNPEKILSLITDKTRLIILNNPNNPTGGFTEKSKIDQLKLTSDDLTEFKSKVTMSASLSKGSTKPIDCEISPKR